MLFLSHSYPLYLPSACWSLIEIEGGGIFWQWLKNQSECSDLVVGDVGFTWTGANTPGSLELRFDASARYGEVGIAVDVHPSFMVETIVELHVQGCCLFCDAQ